MAKRTTPITDPRDVSPAAKPHHGLDPEDQPFTARRNNEQLVERRYAIHPELILAISRDPAAIKAAEERLAQTPWAQRVEWTELGTLDLDTKSASGSGEGSASATGRGITIGGTTSIAEARNKGFFNLQAAFERGIKSEFEEEKDAEREMLQQAQAAAKEALAALLPPQAFLFVPLDELARAQQEAERLARDFAKECLKTQKDHDKDAMKKGGKSHDLKASLGKKLRGLSLRHDGRMHIHPFSGRYAPETGVATVAIIESRHQSITGEHGHARMGTR